MQEIVLLGAKSELAEELLELLPAHDIQPHVVREGQKEVEEYFEKKDFNYLVAHSSPSNLELVEKLYSRNKSNIYVLISTSPQTIDAETAFDLGATACFSENVDAFRIVKSLQSLMTLKRNALSFRPPRYWTNQCVMLTSKQESLKAHGQLLNIGRGGFYALFDQLPFEVAETVHCKIDPGAGVDIELRLEAEIRWLKGDLSQWTDAESSAPASRLEDFNIGAGFQFKDLSNELRTQLQSSLSKVHQNLILPVT